MALQPWVTRTSRSWMVRSRLLSPSGKPAPAESSDGPRGVPALTRFHSPCDLSACPTQPPPVSALLHPLSPVPDPCLPAAQLQLKLLPFLKGKGGGGDREKQPPQVGASESQWRAVSKDTLSWGWGWELRLENQEDRELPTMQGLKNGYRGLSGRAGVGDPRYDPDLILLLFPLCVATGGPRPRD